MLKLLDFSGNLIIYNNSCTSYVVINGFFNLINITRVMRILTILEPVGAFMLVTPLSSLIMKKENMQQKRNIPECVYQLPLSFGIKGDFYFLFNLFLICKILHHKQVLLEWS